MKIFLQWNFDNACRGFFPRIVMAKEGFVEIAGAMGSFVHQVVKAKELAFKKAIVDFSQECFHGDLVDVDAGRIV